MSVDSDFRRRYPSSGTRRASIHSYMSANSPISSAFPRRTTALREDDINPRRRSRDSSPSGPRRATTHSVPSKSRIRTADLKKPMSPALLLPIVPMSSPIARERSPAEDPDSDIEREIEQLKMEVARRKAERKREEEIKHAFTHHDPFSRDGSGLLSPENKDRIVDLLKAKDPVKKHKKSNSLTRASLAFFKLTVKNIDDIAFSSTSTLTDTAQQPEKKRSLEEPKAETKVVDRNRTLSLPSKSKPPPQSAPLAPPPILPPIDIHTPHDSRPLEGGDSPSWLELISDDGRSPARSKRPSAREDQIPLKSPNSLPNLGRQTAPNSTVSNRMTSRPRTRSRRYSRQNGASSSVSPSPKSPRFSPRVVSPRNATASRRYSTQRYVSPQHPNFLSAPKTPLTPSSPMTPLSPVPPRLTMVEQRRKRMLKLVKTFGEDVPFELIGAAAVADRAGSFDGHTSESRVNSATNSPMLSAGFVPPNQLSPGPLATSPLPLATPPFNHQESHSQSSSSRTPSPMLWGAASDLGPVPVPLPTRKRSVLRKRKEKDVSPSDSESNVGQGDGRLSKSKLPTPNSSKTPPTSLAAQVPRPRPLPPAPPPAAQIPPPFLLSAAPRRETSISKSPSPPSPPRHTRSFSQSRNLATLLTVVPPRPKQHGIQIIFNDDEDEMHDIRDVMGRKEMPTLKPAPRLKPKVHEEARVSILSSGSEYSDDEEGEWEDVEDVKGKLKARSATLNSRRIIASGSPTEPKLSPIVHAYSPVELNWSPGFEPQKSAKAGRRRSTSLGNVLSTSPSRSSSLPLAHQDHQPNDRSGRPHKHKRNRHPLPVDNPPHSSSSSGSSSSSLPSPDTQSATLLSATYLSPASRSPKNASPALLSPNNHSPMSASSTNTSSAGLSPMSPMIFGYVPPRSLEGRGQAQAQAQSQPTPQPPKTAPVRQSTLPPFQQYQSAVHAHSLLVSNSTATTEMRRNMVDGSNIEEMARLDGMRKRAGSESTSRRAKGDDQRTEVLRRTLGGGLAQSAGATGLVGRGSIKRKETRQGWSGEWNQRDIQDVIHKLRIIK